MAFPQTISSTARPTADIAPLSPDDIAQFRAFIPAEATATTLFTVLAQVDVTAMTPATASQEVAARALVVQDLIESHPTAPGTYAVTAMGYIRIWVTLAQEAEASPPQITTDAQRHLVESWLAYLRQQLAGTWGDPLASKILQTILMYFCMLVLNTSLPGAAVATEGVPLA